MGRKEAKGRERRRQRRAGEEPDRRAFLMWAAGAGLGLGAVGVGGYAWLTREDDVDEPETTEEVGLTEVLQSGLELYFGEDFLEQIGLMEGGLETVTGAMRDYTDRYGFSSDIERVIFNTEDLSGRNSSVVGDIVQVTFESSRPGLVTLDLGLLVEGDFIFDGKQVESVEERRGALRSIVLHAATHALRDVERMRVNPGIALNEDQTLVGVEGFALVVEENGVETGFTMIEEGIAEGLRFEMGDELKMSVLYEVWGRVTQNFLRSSGVSAQEAAELNQKNGFLEFVDRLFEHTGETDRRENIVSLGFVYVDVADTLRLGMGEE